nr:anthranilate synthase component II [Cystoclonium purpureum f. stellatum]
MILIIDNYDSFTQNLVQCVGELGFEIQISRNDEISIQDINFLNPSHIILSPGPGSPKDSDASLNLIKVYANKIPILGVCLGHQSIAYAYGGKITQLDKPVHGKTSEIIHNNIDLFKDLPNPLIAARYHSLIINHNQFPDQLEVTAWTDEGVIMACRHRDYKLLRGIQFHPESLWTEQGKNIIRNFLFK